MRKALEKLLFFDERRKDLTAKGQIINGVCILVVFLPVALAVYTYLYPKVGDGLAFVVAYVITNWLMLPIREGLYSRFTFTAEKAELKRRSEIFKSLK